MTTEQAFDLYLPKWPQCIITGKSVTPEQALEIIRRTDVFFTHGYEGNNRAFNTEARRICRCLNEEETGIPFEEFWERLNKFKEDWQTVSTNYIFNDWVSSSYIGGPHGWCHPDGAIGFAENIGKWPTVKEVYDDLVLLGETFPFLELTVTLMSGEYSEENTYPVVSMQLKDSKVEIIEPIKKSELLVCTTSTIEEKIMHHIQAVMIGNSYTENHFSLEQIQKWADQVYGGKDD